MPSWRSVESLDATLVNENDADAAAEAHEKGGLVLKRSGFENMIRANSCPKGQVVRRVGQL